MATKKERIKRRIEESLEKAKEERKAELLRRRIEMARQGLRSYELGRLGDAAKNLKTYIRVLEEWKSVPQGGLTPAHFDVKKDREELFLISGVYWDLAKLYDRTRTASKMTEMQHYLDKFVIFSKGLKHQSISIETIRKYTRANRPVHKAPFRDAYKKMAGGGCFVLTSLQDLSDESVAETYYRFRDRVLMHNSVGRILVKFYYLIGPRLANTLDRMPTLIRRAASYFFQHLGRVIELLFPRVRP